MKIMLVEDSTPLRGLIERALMSAGHEVTTAADGQRPQP